MILTFIGSILLASTTAQHGNDTSIDPTTKQLTLKPGWNWISFPRLDRDPEQNLSVPSETVLNERIKPGPDNAYLGTMQYLDYNETYPDNEHMIDIQKIAFQLPWDKNTGELDYVSSPQGFQISVRPDQEYIELFGEIQDPSIPIELHEDFENWVGYFLPYRQSPIDAIPSATQSNLVAMRSQYWSCVKDDPAPPDGPGNLWRCVVNQGKLSLNYGDMVMLYSNADDDFTWQQNPPQVEGSEKPQSELFTYTEQADYESYFIELDSANLPYEIGAMVEDTCIGATKVLDGDTTVLICAYTEGFEGEEVNFQFEYPTKTLSTRIDEYYVMNNRTGINEKRKIKIGDKQPYYFISFGSNTNEPPGQDNPRISLHPNPASREVSVFYFIPEESEVTIHLVNSMGKGISIWRQGIQNPGSYQVIMSTADIPSGYYLVRLETKYSTMTEKLCIIH